LCGDLVDGPGDRLLEEYRGLAEVLGEIPDEVLVFAIPGEHDTASILEPQPGLLDEALRLFSGLGNFSHGGNPCSARLSSVPVLLYHGRSLEDWSSTGTGGPCEMMREMMVRRHVAPTYGSAVPLAPSGKDPFLIGDVPRLLCVGHTHTLCSATYKGVLMLSSPSWKGADREKGAGTVHVVDLSTLDRWEINFAR
jgi:DNA polymerase II small subunit